MGKKKLKNYDIKPEVDTADLLYQLEMGEITIDQFMNGEESNPIKNKISRAIDRFDAKPSHDPKEVKKFSSPVEVKPKQDLVKNLNAIKPANTMSLVTKEEELPEEEEETMDRDASYGREYDPEKFLNPENDSRMDDIVEKSIAEEKNLEENQNNPNAINPESFGVKIHEYDETDDEDEEDDDEDYDEVDEDDIADRPLIRQLSFHIIPELRRIVFTDGLIPFTISIDAAIKDEDIDLDDVDCEEVLNEDLEAFYMYYINNSHPSAMFLEDTQSARYPVAITSIRDYD